MADDTEIEQMLDEKMQENGDKKEKEKEKEKDKSKDREKKHKKHKHHKSHKSDKKHDRKRSRSRSRSPVPIASGKRANVNSALHQLAESLSRRGSSRERSPSKSSRREKSPDLTNEERDLRTVFCESYFQNKIFVLFCFVFLLKMTSTFILFSLLSTRYATCSSDPAERFGKILYSSRKSSRRSFNH